MAVFLNDTEFLIFHFVYNNIIIVCLWVSLFYALFCNFFCVLCLLFLLYILPINQSSHFFCYYFGISNPLPHTHIKITGNSTEYCWFNCINSLYLDIECPVLWYHFVRFLFTVAAKNASVLRTVVLSCLLLLHKSLDAISYSAHSAVMASAASLCLQKCFVSLLLSLQCTCIC